MNSSTRKTILRLAGFVLSILLIFIGILLMRRSVLLAGSLLLAGSVLIFLVSIRSIEKNPLTDEEQAYFKPYVFPVILIFASLVMTGLLVFNISSYPRTSEANHLASAEWLLSLVCLTSGILWLAGWRLPRLQAAWEWIKANPFELGLITLILIAGLVIRLAALTEHPYPWSGDEASIGIEARRILQGDNSDWFNTGWSGQPNVSFLPTAINMLIFGKTIFAVKMTSVLCGTLAVLALYLLAREWFGREVALVASGFMAAYPFHLQFSRIGVDNVFDSLMAPLVIWLIFRAARTKNLSAYLAAGIATGLTFYTYVGTRLVLAFAVGAIIYIILRRKGYWRSNLPQLGTYLSSMLVTLAPIGTFFIKNPSLFMTRLGQEGIFLNGWLPRQVELTGQSVWQILLDQFLKTVLVFFSQDAINYLRFDRPLLTILGAIFFVMGLAIAFRHLLDERYFILHAWFWSVLFLGSFLTLNPPGITRMVMTIPATSLFIGLGVWQMSKALLYLKFSKAYVYSLISALVFVLGFQNLVFYFGVYRTGYFARDVNGELAMEAGLQLKQLGNGYDYYLFGEPRVFSGFPTMEFLDPDNPKYDLNAESVPTLAFNPGRGAFIVAIPENKNLLQEVSGLHPGGMWEIVPRKTGDEVLYYAYIITPGQVDSP